MRIRPGLLTLIPQVEDCSKLAAGDVEGTLCIADLGKTCWFPACAPRLHPGADLAEISRTHIPRIRFQGVGSPSDGSVVGGLT